MAGGGRWLQSKGAGFQRRYLHSDRMRGGITQLPGDATAVIGCSTWVKRAFILPTTLYSENHIWKIRRKFFDIEYLIVGNRYCVPNSAPGSVQVPR